MANSSTVHPYYPIEAQLIGYLANEWSVVTLVGAFALGWGGLLLLTYLVVSYVRPSLRMCEKLAILWFVLSTFFCCLLLCYVGKDWLIGCVFPLQAEAFIFSSRVISLSTIPVWRRRRTSLVSSGRNTPSLTRDTLLRIHLSCAWKRLLRYVA